MSTNATMMIAQTTELVPYSFRRDALSDPLYVALSLVLLPCISALGIVGNVTGIVILHRRGFKRCSNVLLMALSVSDVLVLVGMHSIPKYIYKYSPGFRFSEGINYMLCILHIVFIGALSIGGYSTMIIPALITGERLMVILFPLKVYFILTPRRISIVVGCLYLFFGIEYMRYYITYTYVDQIVVDGATVGFISFTDAYENALDSGLIRLRDDIINYITGIIPICFVTSGCVVIGIHIAFSARRRKKLTSLKPGTNKAPSRTTKTLLCICVLNIVCTGFGFFREWIEDAWPLRDDVWRALQSIQDLLVSLNCVGDFVIYVRANNSNRRSSNVKL